MKKNERFKLFIALVILSLLFSSSLFAGITGKIAGVVKDKQNGAPLAGVNVVIDGTYMGAATNVEGKYFILHVPVGSYSVKATMMGYNSMIVTNVRVTIDHTTEINFELEAMVLEAEEVTVVAERPLIVKDNTSSRSFISADDMTAVVFDNIDDLVSTKAGVIEGTVRGGRASETITYLDGVSLQDPMSGYGLNPVGYRGEGGGPRLTPGATDVDGGEGAVGVQLPDFAVEEMEVVTGGANAEYGNSQSGLINIASREGGSKHTAIVRYYYEGDTEFSDVRYRSWMMDPDLSLAPPYYDPNDPSVMLNEGQWIWVKDGKEKLYSDGLENAKRRDVPIWNEAIGNQQRQKLSFNLGGPVPLLPRLLPGDASYSLSGTYLDQDKGRYNNQDRVDYSFLGKVAFKFSPSHKLVVNTLVAKQDYGVYDYEGTKYRGGYWPGYGPIYPTAWSTPRRIRNNNLQSLVWTHTISPKTYYTITLGRFHSEFDQKMRDYNDRDGDGNTDEYITWRELPVPKYRWSEADSAFQWVDEDEWRFMADDMSYIWTQNPTKIDSVNFPDTYDPGYQGEYKIGNNGFVNADHVWSESNPSGWKQVYIPTYNPDSDQYTWRSEWRFVTGAMEREEEGFTHQEQTESTVYGVPDEHWIPAGDIQWQFRDYDSDVYNARADFSSQVTTNHFIQGGAEFKYYDLLAKSIQGYAESNLYLDIWDQDPFEFAVFVRDKIETQGMIVNLGLRYDFYNLNGFTGDNIVYSDVAEDRDQAPIDPSKEQGEEGYIVDPITVKGGIGKLSPRLGISHPITDRDVLHFSYGHYLQRPDWRYFFENLAYSHRGAYEQIGNPLLKPQKTVSYEVGVTHQFTENLKIDITGYYRDIYGWIQMAKAGDLAATHYWIYRNADFGNVRGFEVSLNKRYSHFFAADINYTYMISKGRLSNPQLGGTYMWRNLVHPREDHPLDYDQSHTLVANFTLMTPKEWGPTFGSFHPLEDWQLNIIHRYGSGLPYDSQSRSVAHSVPAENDERRPATSTTDMRLSRRVTLFKTLATSLFVEGFNVFNNKNLLDEPMNAEWYQSREDLDGNGVPDHYLDPEGRRNDFTVWGEQRRVRAGIEIQW